MKKTTEEVIAYRLQKAVADLETAKSIAGFQHWDGTVNRLYYAAFHVLTAIMLHEGIRVKSHTGVKTMFSDHFVKTNRIDGQWGKFYSHLFKSRNDSDYEDFAIFTAEDVLPLLPQTEEFIGVIKRMINL